VWFRSDGAWLEFWVSLVATKTHRVHVIRGKEPVMLALGPVHIHLAHHVHRSQQQRSDHELRLQLQNKDHSPSSSWSQTGTTPSLLTSPHTPSHLHMVEPNRPPNRTTKLGKSPENPYYGYLCDPGSTVRSRPSVGLSPTLRLRLEQPALSSQRLDCVRPLRGRAVVGWNCLEDAGAGRGSGCCTRRTRRQVIGGIHRRISVPSLLAPCPHPRSAFGILVKKRAF
jgi:hypothetical protein